MSEHLTCFPIAVQNSRRSQILGDHHVGFVECAAAWLERMGIPGGHPVLTERLESETRFAARPPARPLDEIPTPPTEAAAIIMRWLNKAVFHGNSISTTPSAKSRLH